MLHIKFLEVFGKSCNARYRKMILSSAPTVQTPIYSFNTEEKENNENQSLQACIKQTRKTYAENSLSSIFTTAGKIWKGYHSNKISCIKI